MNLLNLQSYFTQRRDGATWQKRANVLNRGTLALAGCDTVLNRIVAVQERFISILSLEEKK